MSDFYDNLLKATNNIDDITTEKYGVITKLNGNYCSVKETDNDLEHHNVPIINGANLNIGDKVIIGFINNSIYDVICYGALDRSLNTELPIVTQWENVLSDEKVPSEKLAKNSLDLKQDTLVSGETIKTLNNQSLLGSGNIAIDDGSRIAYGQVDSTSTSTVFTATVDGISELSDGVAVMLRNGVVTSASGFTLNVNNLGAKPVYNSMADASRDTTIFNVAYTMLFVYDSERVSGGCWICYRGYDSNTNTIGYQLRTNSTKYKTLDKLYRYRLLLQVDDDTFMPANTLNSTSASSNKSSAMNNREFMIDGKIIYYNSTSVVDANADIGATSVWEQYTLTLGYSFNNTSSALSLQYPKSVYIVAEPTSNGKAKLHTPYYTQSLPNSEDGLIYIHLGQMYSATQVELALEHKAYEYKNGAIREYNNANIDDYDVTFTYSFGVGGVDDTITIHTELIERSD